MFLFKKKAELKHKGTKNIQTERFVLRKFCIDDAEDMYKNWMNDADAARYNAWSIHNSVSETRAFVREWVGNYDKTNYYQWAITTKDTGEVIGSISASNIKDKSGYCEIGYTVAKKYWNRGIATEVVKIIIKYLTEDIGFKDIRAFHDIRNKASGRVMQKAGMNYIKNQKQIFLNSTNVIMDCCVYSYKI